MGSQPKVFIVEDDDGVRDSLLAVMNALGIEAEGFLSSPAFLKAANGSRHGCVILDLQMPVMGGFDVLTAMAARGIGLPVIVISGHLNQDGEARLKEAGVRAVLRKPLDIDLLVETIRKALAA